MSTDDDLDQPDRPVAVGGREPSGDGPDVPGDAPDVPDAGTLDLGELSELGPGDVPGPPFGPPAAERAPEVDRPGVETLLALSALGLALSVMLLPWYRGPFNVSGWASGTWGPVIFFLSVAAIVIVGLRRASIALSFPLHAPLILEVIGWLSVLAILAKRWFRAEFPAGRDLDVGAGLWVALVFAGAIALLGGRVSRDAPFVIRPGWHRGPAGTRALAILLVAVAAGAVFGLTNSFGPATLAGAGGPQNNVRRVDGYPDCANAIPIPKGVKALQGTEPGPGQEGSFCVASLTSTAKLSTIHSRYRDALEGAGWTFSTLPVTEGTRQIVLEKPQCGQVRMERQGTESKGVSITIFTQSVCPTQTPTAQTSR